MERIAILTSTSPLRKTASHLGVTKQRFNVGACIELNERFDVIIVGSLAADEVTDYMQEHMPREILSKFRFYSRSFFSRPESEDLVAAAEDPRNAGWQQILSENGVKFDVLLGRRGAESRTRRTKFSWERLSEFIRDSRVTLVSGGEGSLIYDVPAGVAR
jgi:hypothetical protein